MRFFIALLAIVAFSLTAQSQESRYVIQFRNKASNPYSLSNPQQFLSQKSMERRNRYNIPLDSTDLPVTPRYIDSVRLSGNVTILNVSKWLNSITIQTTDAAALNKIRNFPFVADAKAIALRRYTGGETFTGAKSTTSQKASVLFEETGVFNINEDYYSYGASYNQVHIHNGEFLHNIGLRGDGLIIGMLDAGYFNYTTLRAFDSVRLSGRILDTWDFVAREQSVVEDNAHGMYCFSIIAANIPGTFVGTAPRASFFLYRTEDVASEYPIEEHNWVVAAERVDSMGGDLISSSLGYSTFQDPAMSYTYADMNGNTTISARGADLAAKKGILVVNSAGNEGNSSWRYISSPADGDSVLAVGAVDVNGQPGSFTSYGPSSDGQVKPDVASVGVGTIVQGTNNSIAAGNGTSFSCPNMAGLATCLWQGFREFNNMKIIETLRRAGSIATAPNDRIGYGIPDMKKAVMMLLQDFSTASANISNCEAVISWKSKDMKAMRYEIERKLPGENIYQKIFSQPGQGNLFAAHEYNINDNLDFIPQGKISYRIKQVIDTSVAGFMAAYIDSVEVNLATSCIPQGSANLVQLYPNPVHSQLTIKIVLPEAIPNLRIRIVDAIGRTVYNASKNKPAGIATYTLPLNHLSSGNYFVSVYNNENLISTIAFTKL